MFRDRLEAVARARYGMREYTEWKPCVTQLVALADGASFILLVDDRPVLDHEAYEVGGAPHRLGPGEKVVYTWLPFADGE